MSHKPTNQDDNHLILEVIQESINIATHLELLNWLNGKFQTILPHDILISAWGDFSLALIDTDVVTLDPMIRSGNIGNIKLAPKIIELFKLWQLNQYKPLILNIEDNFFGFENLTLSNSIEQVQIRKLLKLKIALLHGVKDNRGRDDCLYILLSEHSMPVNSKMAMPMLMPHIDCALRRIDQLQVKEEEVEISKKLSYRECEIMNFVKEGKTNDEIALILEISMFTVKNHLQRIFTKLGVTNRSQATNKFISIRDRD
jgi:transcriptional regulator EpsA